MNQLDTTIQNLVKKLNSPAKQSGSSQVNQIKNRARTSQIFLRRSHQHLNRTQLLKIPTKKQYDFTKNFKSGIVSHKTTNITNQFVLPEILSFENELSDQTKSRNLLGDNSAIQFEVQDEDYEYAVTAQRFLPQKKLKAGQS